MEQPLSGYRGNGPYVFVCYAHEDTDAVYREIAWLNDYGVNVWYDEGISPGHEWREELAAAIQGCTRVLYFVTPNSVVSEHCRRELNFAQEENREVVAIHLRPTEVPAGLRLGLNNRQAILKYELAEDEFHKRLMRVVQGAEGSTARPVPVSGGNPQTWRTGIALAGVALVLIAVGTWWFTMRDVAPADTDPEVTKTADEVASPESSRNSIAVLPFVNMSPDPDQEYFSDGISEELLNLLAKNPELKVISRSSAFTFKGKDIDIPTVAERLGVAHVLEGSVRKADNRVRITAQLIDAETDTHLWSDTFDRELTDIFAIQDEIAGQVVEALNLTLFGPPATKKEPNLDAYALYLQGRHLRTSTAETQENLEQAQAMLEQALELDPNYAEAWIELADVYGSMRFIGVMARDQARRLRLEALERARTIDPENADIYGHLAFDAIIEDRDLASAARFIERGLALEPANLNLIEAAGDLAVNLGRLSDAVALHEYVTARDPLCSFCVGKLSANYMLQGRLDEAAAAYETYELIGPLSGFTSVGALIMLLQGKHESSLATWERVPNGLFRTYGEAITLYSMGRDEQFSVKFQDLKDEYGADFPTMVARVYAWMGDVDTAFEWLDRYTPGQPELGQVIVNQMEFLSVEFQPLHDDPRWQTHLQKLRVTAEQMAAIEFGVSLPK